MYVFQGLFSLLKENKALRMGVIAAALGLVVIAILGSLLQTPVSKSKVVSVVPLSQDNYPMLIDSSLLYFNGVNFLKMDASTHTIETLSKGYSFPRISALTWVGKSGAMMVLEELPDSDITADYIKAHPEDAKKYDFTNESYVWYFDFQTNTIRPIGSLAIDNRASYYDASSGLFYFIAHQNNNPQSQRSLYAYKPLDQSVQTLQQLPTSSQYGVTVSPCDTFTVCVIAQDHTDTMYSLLGLQNSRFTTLYTTKDEIVPSNNKKQFALIHSSAPKNVTEDSEEYVSQSTASVSIFHVADKTISKPLADVNGVQNIFPLFLDDAGSVSLYSNVDDKNIQTTHISPSLLSLPTKTTQTSLAKNDMIPSTLVSYSYTEPAMLLYSNAGSLIYVGKEKFPAISSDPSSIVKACTEKYNGRYGYTNTSHLFSVYVVFADTFNDNVSTVMSCINEKPAVLFGYNFEVKGIDAKSGRIVTN